MFVFYSKSQTGVWTNSVLKTSRTKIKQRGVPESGSEGGTIHDVELAVKKTMRIGGQIKGTSCPRTAFLPPHTPVWRSTSAGRFPGGCKKNV